MKAYIPRALIVSSLVFASSLLAAEEPQAGSEPRSRTVTATNVTQPVPTFQARPRYPTDMRKQGITGQVIVDFVIDEKGNVTGARAIRSTRKEFEAAAVEAVSKWKFKPGIKDGVPVKVHMQTPVVFTLNAKN